MSIFLDSELTASERSEAARFRVIPYRWSGLSLTDRHSQGPRRDH